MSWHLDAEPGGLRLRTPSGESHHLGWRWLRDHGEDPASFDPATKQRRVDVLDADIAAATGAVVGESPAGDAAVVLDWPDADPTWISLDTLTALLEPPVAGLQRAWCRSIDLDIHLLDIADVLHDDAMLSVWLGDIAQFGIGRLQGFDGTRDQVNALIARIGYVRESIFGGIWELASDISDHDDTAYSQSFLAPHTDGTYSHDAPGLQMFCCVDRSGDGGESTIVDGLALANELRAERPDLFEVLTTVNVPAHYIEPGIELRAERPAIRLNRRGEFAQISLNNYDRSPMLLDAERMDAFYEAYGTLQRMADDRDRWWSVRLNAGDVLINDNWRVLHGRMAYTGERRFFGCYFNREDFESRCRVLGVA